MPIEITCTHCSKVFRVQPKYAKKKFCSRECMTSHEAVHGRPAARLTPVDFTCQECSKPFTMMQSYLTAYRKKFGKAPMYCSRSCSSVGRRKTADARNSFTCEQCGKTQPLKRGPDGNFYYEQKYCNRRCKADAQRAAALHRFESGGYKKHTKRHGYVWMTIPELARGPNGQRHVMEHRYVMSKHLGRDLLPDETVHHIDGVRSHNDLTNLELFSSRHGPGQRVTDKVTFAIEILSLYPDFARQAGYALHRIEHDSSDAILSLPG